MEHKWLGFKGKSAGWTVREEFPEQVAFFIFLFICFFFFIHSYMWIMFHNMELLHSVLPFSSYFWTKSSRMSVRSDYHGWHLSKGQDVLSKNKPTNRGTRKFSAFLSKEHACFGRTTVQGWGGYWQESRWGSHLRKLPTASSSANSPSSCIVRAMFLGYSYFK